MNNYKFKNLIEFSADAGPFRYIPDIENISSKDLDKAGYYKGFPCVYGHVIRDKEFHWCYHCAIKIQSNILNKNIKSIDISTIPGRGWAMDGRVLAMDWRVRKWHCF